MTRRSYAVVVAVVLTGTVVGAYATFYSDADVGPVFPASAAAGLTCYPVDSGYQLASANTTRTDILATFIKRDAEGHDISVCFLRPLAVNGDWSPRMLPPGVAAPTSAPTCPGYPSAPFPGAVCYADGGWR